MNLTGSEFYTELYKRLKPSQILVHEDMKKHTSFQAGGKADYFIIPANVEQLRFAIDRCRACSLPYTVIGKGTNLLVLDGGYRGAVIQLLRGFNEIRWEGLKITAGAGALLSAIANIALKAGLAGFEFAPGIPGTLGGAVYMNAGAYGGEIRNVFDHARVLLADGRLESLNGEDMAFGYRTSLAQRENMVILEAELSFHEGDMVEIKKKMLEYNKQRKDKQPLDLPSAGSTFKRPPGRYAGQLIMESGLAGCRLGGAAVSEKHCGFLVNAGGATATDIITLIERVQNKVYEKFGVRLEPEVRIIGEK